MAKNWFALLLILLAPGLAWAGDATPEDDVSLVIEDAWVRALPPTQKMTAGYLRLHNSGEKPLAVVGASADIAKLVEIHTTQEVDGLMRMQQLESLQLSPGESLELSPGGTHLMIMGMERMPRAGEDVQLCLQLASGGEVCTVAAAQKTQPQDAGAHKHHH